MQKVHFLGIGGSGASAAASIAKAQGYEISGCDKSPFNEFTENFEKNILLEGHSPNHLKGIDILAVTPAIYSLDPNNPELEEAKNSGLEVLTWQEFMGKYLEKEKLVIAVCGTHGKSTTTAMIGQMLEDAGLDPTVELGAIVPKWKSNHRIGKGKYFVTEADEFNDNFLASTPDIAVVTNIEMDHPEYFADFESVKQSFGKFLRSAKETIIANMSDPVVKEILAVHPKGVNSIIDYSEKLIDFPLQIPGDFNIMNAQAAYQVGIVLEIDPEKIKKSLSSYTGLGRRFEYLGEFSGAKIYSDFGHHPTEIKVTMEAARQKFPKNRILLIYQPHMFSRTKFLFDGFVKVFKSLPVDKIILIDIYPSRETDTGIVSTQQLVDAINSDTSMYQSKDEILPNLKKQIQKDDVVFFMGAGDSDKLARELLSLV